MRVRIQSAAFKHFKNVSLGEIRFPCNLGADIFSMKSDVLGIYGPNGSGKSTFIYVLWILKCLLSGTSIKEHFKDCISKGSDEAELSFKFSVEDDYESKFCMVYSAKIGPDYLNESVKVSILRDNGWSRISSIMVSRSTDFKTVITPTSKRNDLFGKDPQILGDLRLVKRLCIKEYRSFLWSGGDAHPAPGQIGWHAMVSYVCSNSKLR